MAIVGRTMGELTSFVRVRALPYNALHDPESRECGPHPRTHPVAPGA